MGRLCWDLGAIHEFSAQITVTVGEVLLSESRTKMVRISDLLTYVKQMVFYPSYVPDEAV